MPPKPRLASYQTLEEYLEALVWWLVDMRLDGVDRKWLRQVGVEWEGE